MNGQVEIHGYIHNWEGVKKILANKPAEEDDWSSDWNWTEDEDTGGGSNSSDKQNENFIQGSKLASSPIGTHMSPVGDVFAMANSSKALFFIGEWDDKEKSIKFTKTFEGQLIQDSSSGETIESVICLPLVSKKKSSSMAPDWTCIVVGFSNGYIRFYTEDGNLLMSQMFHNEPIKSFRCRSYQPGLNSLEHDQLEELLVLYGTVLVSIDGFGLFQTLRACRNQLARIQANLSETIIDNPVLTYKKWKFDNVGKFRDVESIGIKTPSTFDHLHTASLLGGIHARCKNAPITSNVFLATGPKNYVSFNFAQEGQSIPVLTELAYAIASKLKSSIINTASGWLGFGGGGSSKSAHSQKEKEKKIEPALDATSRFGLVDLQREGRAVSLSPCRKLSALSDSLGRVILIDNDLGLAIRILKGYRGCEIGWYEIQEKISSRAKAPGRKALFLLIHMPKRGLIEVFAMNQGPKVATFNLAKNGRLLQSNYGLMGNSNIPMHGGNRPPLQSLFISNEGQLFSFNIPFHLALCDKTNSKVKDIHLLKTLQKKLRDEMPGAGDILEILREIKNQSMINQAFKILTQKCKQIEIISKIAQDYIDQNSDKEDRDLNAVFRIQSICELYSFLTACADMPPVYMEEESSSSDPHSFLKCLHMTDKEVKILELMANKEMQNQKAPAKSVKFRKDEETLNPNEFFAAFNIDFDPNKIAKEGRIRINTKCDHLTNLVSLLFCGCFNGSSDLGEWKTFLQNASLVPSEILLLILQYWSKNALKSSSYITLMERFYKIARVICELEGLDKVVSDFGTVSKWWEEVRKEITKSPQIFYIYSFSIVCRAVAFDLQNDVEHELKKNKEKPPPRLDGDDNAQEPSISSEMEKSLEEGDWENISYDSVRWNILIKQIEDLDILSSLVEQKPKLSKPTLPLLKNEIKEISAVDLLQKGRGCIAELVGKFLTTTGIDPSLISDLSEKPLLNAPQGSPKSKRKRSIQKEEEHKGEEEPTKAVDSLIEDSGVMHILELLSNLKENFSVSLNPSIILANYAWEYCLEFNKDCNQVQYLEAALNCVNGISAPFLKHGMIVMMWNTFILRKFSILSSKSKENRDQCMEKWSGFTENEKKNLFLKMCVQFLDLLMDVSVKCEGEGVSAKSSNLQADPQSTRWSSNSSSASLTDLAISQPMSNYEMILLHYQLALCTHFVYYFNIKKPSMKPVNFFDTKSAMLFYQGLHAQAPFSCSEVDLALKNLREEFLCLIISYAIHAISEEFSDDSNSEMIVPSKEGVLESEDWISKCFELGRIWGLDSNGLKINQICEYYSCGLDKIGSDAIGGVNEKRDILGSKLLVVLGMRLNYIVRSRTGNVPEVVASLSTNLTNWLYNLNYSRLRSLRFTKESVRDLAHQIIHIIPDSNYDYKLAEEIHSVSSLLI